MLTTIKLYAQSLQKKKEKNSRDRGVCDGREPTFEDMMIDILTIIEIHQEN